jgi:autotransporter-associated beta strand protein
MKIHCSNRFPALLGKRLASQVITICSVGIASATPYYWDTNSTSAGFGNASGTWGTDAFWNDSTTGGAGTFANSTATTDLINFGNGVTGLATGSIAVGTASAGNITFASGSGAISLTGGTLTLAAAATLTTNNAADSISSILAGAGTSLTKAGTGTLTLSGANTYAGTTTIGGTGKLNIQNNSALGSTTSGTSVTSGGSLQLQNDITVTGETLSLAGHATAFALQNISGNNTWAGTINVNTVSSLARIASEAGTLTLSGPVVTSGTSANGLVLQGAGNGLVSGIISGSGSLTKGSTGTGTWILSGANTYTGLTTVSSLLNVRNNSALGATTAGTTVTAGGSLQMQGGITVTGEALTLTAVVGTNALPNGLVNVSGNNEWAGSIAGNLTSGNNIRLSSSADSLTVSGNVAITSSAAGNSLVLTGAGNGAISGTISVGATSSTSLIKSGTGTWSLSGANSFEGATQVQAGALSVASLNSVSGGSSSSNLGAPKTAAAGTISLALVGATLTPGTLIYTGGGETTDRIISLTGYTAGGTLQADNASGLLKFTSAMTAPGIALQDNRKTLTLAGSGSGEFAGAIVNSALGGSGLLATSIVKAGEGIWTLSGANTHTGNTLISAGTLEIGNALALQNSVLDPSGAGALTFAGGINTPTFGGLTSATNLTLAANVTTLTLNPGTGVTATYSGGLGSATTGMNLTKTGAGTQELSGANSYTGATTVSNGTLVVNGNISTSNLTTVENNGTLGGAGIVGALTALSGGSITPGNGPGILSAGNLTLQTASTLGIGIDGATAGSGYDQLNVSGSVSLAGLLDVTTAYTPANNSLFFILANDGADAITGTFSNAPVDGGIYSFGPQDFQISYFGNSAANTFTGGNDVVLMAVPEPDVVMLLGGFGLLALLRRRRN